MTKTFFFSAFFFFISIAVLQATVIGIDFGTEYFKISLIRPGKSFVIIENTTTKRKTASAVLFLAFCFISKAKIF